jgi:hypothetical protein
MTIVRTTTYLDIYALLAELEDRSLTLKAFGSLLECAMRDRDSGFTENDALGAYLILEQQFKALDFLGKALRDQYNALKSAPVDFGNIDEIAALSGVSRQKAIIVLSCATGLNPSYFEGKGAPA